MTPLHFPLKNQSKCSEIKGPVRKVSSLTFFWTSSPPSLEQREHSLERREHSLEQREHSLEQREHSLEQREHSLEHMNDPVAFPFRNPIRIKRNQGSHAQSSLTDFSPHIIPAFVGAKRALVGAKRAFVGAKRAFVGATCCL